MLHTIITALTDFIIQTISTLGYTGVAVLMAIESAAIPLPSEIIMPFAGFLVGEGRFTLFGIAIAGGIGSVVGSVITYFIGMYGGRPLVEKYGKYIFMSKHDLDLADKFFAKYGLAATFIGRILPVFRTFISIPAGIARVPFLKFIFYTFIGSVIWSYALGYFGLKLGQRWLELRERAHSLDYIIAGLIIIGLIWWIRRHYKNRIR